MITKYKKGFMEQLFFFCKFGAKNIKFQNWRPNVLQKFKDPMWKFAFWSNVYCWGHICTSSLLSTWHHKTRRSIQIKHEVIIWKDNETGTGWGSIPRTDPSPNKVNVPISELKLTITLLPTWPVDAGTMPMPTPSWYGANSRSNWHHHTSWTIQTSYLSCEPRFSKFLLILNCRDDR